MESASPVPQSSPESSSEARIRDAALTSFASRGIAATSIRAVAEAAGVSIGLVQHYYKTKAALVSAVDQHVLHTIRDAIGASTMRESPDEALSRAGKQLTALMADHPLVVDYLARALIEGGEIGSVVFDGLVGISKAQRDQFDGQGVLHADLDPLWAVLNPLILRVGAVILRPHVERHLHAPFLTAPQLQRWDDAVTKLLKRGQFE